MQHALVFDADLIKRYDKAGPRYTSYPTAVQFHEGFGEVQYRAWARHSGGSGEEIPSRPLSLYFHIPFCDTVCYYCACNKVVTKDRSKAGPYMQRLEQEIRRQGEMFGRERPVQQLHWGGGTPTFISHDEMRFLMDATRRHFALMEDDSGEYSIEIDPREADRETLALLRDLGFNRISMGVQDFDPTVQRSVNRIQSEEETFAVLQYARELGFRSVNIDLIYGLPFQTVQSFARTVEKIIAVSPDRLSVFNYAHLPELFKPQRRIRAEDLPPPAEKLSILHTTIRQLTEAGYVYIGMDHFAKPDDELAIAQRQGNLYRNFQGYSTHADCDLIAMGVTAISKVGDSYSQNARDLAGYYDRLDSGRLPVFRGVELNFDDRLRREVITQLICHFKLDFAPVEAKYGIRFGEYFGRELADLDTLRADGLLQMQPHGIEVLPVGKLLIRNVCMVFDRYLREQQTRRFSKVI